MTMHAADHPPLTVAAGAAVLTPGEMRAAEAAAIAAGAPALTLMERAAAAAAHAIACLGLRGPALVLCGPGNNGGDGYALACRLRAAGMAVRVAASSPARGEPAATMAARWGGPVEVLADATSAPLLIDALFGTGLARPLPAEVAAVLDRLRGTAAFVLALDIPSGVDGLTGVARGGALAADVTIAFGALKQGLVSSDGAARAGRILVADIGLAIDSDVRLVPPPVRRALAADTYKYRRGSVAVIEGEPIHGGATQLTALAALRSGAGLVTLVGEGTALPAAAVMRRSDRAGVALLSDRRTAAIAIGPGLSDDQRGRDWLARVLAGPTPAVIDAGALAIHTGALVAGSGWEGFAGAKAPLVLTPHDGEFARLFGPPGLDRIGAARAAALASGAVVVLKGAATVIAAPDGRAAVNTHAAPWLATAGSGDVLTGIIAGLLAQGLAPFDAARAGVWLHGDAGLRGGPGLIADDIVALLPAVLAAL